MTRTEIINRALAAVADSRLKRERDSERRKQIFGRIDLTTPLPKLSRGVQLNLNLEGGRKRSELTKTKSH
ncbi:hypothetical protein AC244_24065 [Ensifer adhaerens]|uniref:Uncharacterized protein n=1 Tax=Ensifer adhaerens TaxID=106592 RepID=A0A0L8BKI7_ENSAD|nr:hypothetical protein [Ensifer adhaerens]KOF15161.1 hypothetical protein AC244_24065 [Ensifer adhaerens]